MSGRRWKDTREALAQIAGRASQCDLTVDICFINDRRTLRGVKASFD